MDEICGIGKKNRVMLGKVISQCKSKLITPEKVAEVLQVTRAQSRRLLQYWKKNGWIFRLRRGLYQPLPLEATNVKSIAEDPWIVANKLFSPCYIAGWSAIEFWNLTEQIFRTIVVISSRSFSKRKYKVNGIEYLLKTTAQKNFFGLKSIWRDSIKVNVSDPSRTIIDLLNDPSIGGGMCSIIDFFKEYLKSEHKSLNNLLDYGKKINNFTIFKRLGFILENLQPQEKDVINDCYQLISKGRSQFDPTVKGNIFISKWSLLIPEAFSKINMEKHYD